MFGFLAAAFPLPVFLVMLLAVFLVALLTAAMAALAFAAGPILDVVLDVGRQHTGSASAAVRSGPRQGDLTVVVFLTGEDGHNISLDIGPSNAFCSRNIVFIVQVMRNASSSSEKLAVREHENSSRSEFYGV
jgi:hypothetical protein